MALEEDIRLLSSVDVFSELNAEQLRLLAFGVEAVSLKAGEDLFNEGDPADGAYVVAAGTVELFRRRGDVSRVIETCKRGDIIGELALIVPTERLIGARAETDAELMRLSRSLFHRILEEYPELAARLHARVASQLRDMVTRISDLAPRFS